MSPEPVVYLVAERRDGRWAVADEWGYRCETLDDARRVAASCRAMSQYRPEDIAVLAVTVVPEEE